MIDVSLKLSAAVVELDLYRQARREWPTEARQLAGEATKRLEKMKWLVEQITRMLEEARAVKVPLPPPGLMDPVKNPPPPGYEEARQLISQFTFALEVLAETFYWNAARARTAIKKIPGLERFEGRAVRDIRNHLIEHPEGKSSGVLVQGFALGKAGGPVLKALREPNQTERFVDRGMFINAREFADELTNLICRQVR